MRNNKIAKKLLKQMDKSMFERLIKFNGYIAGGAILSAFTNNKINDFDLYFKSIKDYEDFIKDLGAVNKESDWSDFNKRPKIKKDAESKVTLINNSHNAKTYLYKGQVYQVITAFTGEPIELFRYFDFSIVMGAFLPNKKEFVYDDNFLVDITSRIIRFNIGTEYPIASMLRLLKYQKRGYTISGIEIIKMGLAVHALNLKSYPELKKQLNGIDTQFLYGLTAAFDEGIYKEKNFEYKEFLTMLDDYIDNLNSNFFKDIDEDE